MRRRLDSSRIEALLDDATALTTAQATERRARYGTNRIVEQPPSAWQDVARETARDPMIWFLAGTALLFVWLGDFVEAGVLAFALLPIAGMDAYLHRRTQASTEGLAGRLATTASVVRDGTRRDLASADLVPGDLVVVAEGGAVPADGLVVAGDSLQADESALTGEAMPVRKSPVTASLVAGGEVAVDGVHWAFAGTRLLTGEARIRIAYTGGETLYGEIVRSAQAGRHERTPLQLAIGALVRALVVVAVVVCCALAAARLVQGHGFVDAIVSAVTLAVAALPEEFPVVFAFFLGVGVYRLARCQALVRRAVVVENIGRVTCICSDKTGTLTEGRLRLAHTEPEEGVGRDRLLAAAAAASRAGSGDPLDVAIAQSAARVQGETLATFPFTEDRRREVGVIRTATGAVLATAKGAPETILGMSRMAAGENTAWLTRARDLAATGHKVIACAERALAAEAWPGGEPDRGYTFLGLLAFEDPVRDGAAAAVANAQGAGIRVLMVTGDHPATARAVASELKLGAGEPRVIEGDALDGLLARDGANALRDVDVIARAVPAQKLGLVQALQRAGEIVAVTGDGVNDVPALQRADIGIAMGESGTRTAREVAAIVLLDDNFRTIVRAIAEGRQLFRNLQLSFAYLLAVHIPLVLTAALIPFAGFPLLYLPAHIVWLELIIHPTAILAFQHAAPRGALEATDGRPATRFFDRREWLVIGVVGTLLTLAVTAGYVRGLGPGQDVAHARALALAILIVASATVTVGLCRMRGRLAWSSAAAAIASAVLLIQAEPLARLLHLSPLRAQDWLLAAGIGLAAGALAALFARAPRVAQRCTTARNSVKRAARSQRV
jgi:Ca2+-transporting ATPase